MSRSAKWGRAELLREMVRHFLLRSGAPEDELESLFDLQRVELDDLIERLQSRGLLQPGEARIITGVWRGYLKGPLAELMPSFAPGERRSATPPAGVPIAAATAAAPLDPNELPAPPVFGTLSGPGVQDRESALELVTPAPSVVKKSRPRAPAGADATERPVIGERLGVYTIAARLGAERWSDLYRVERAEGEPAVALARVLRADAPREVAQTLRVRTPSMLKLRHPAILGPFAGGTYRGRPYLVFPFIVGLNLGDHLEIVGQLEPRALQELAAQLVDGLTAAQRAGIAHGDVRPEHVLRDDSQRYKLTGFGFSPTRHARLGTKPPTPVDAMYCAPEQLDHGEPIDHRADMYGLGATLYRAAVGHAPFCEPRVADPVQARLHRDPVPVEVHVSEFPSLLSHFISRMLRRRPEDRFPAWSEARAALRHIINVGGPREAAVERRS